MAKNPFGISSSDTINFFGNGPTKKRSLNQGDKNQIYKRAKGKCEACGKKIDQPDMQVGHMKAFSKGGATNLNNSVCLCYTCNNLMRTKNYYTFMKEMSYSIPKRLKDKLAEKEAKVKEKPKKKRRSSNNPFGITPIKITPITKLKW
mgnify:CR=1 FL=1